MAVNMHALGQLRVFAARCDDCGALVLAAPTEAALTWMLAQRDHAWRPGLPIFCGDQWACAERCWRLYGAHMQAVIDELNHLERTLATVDRAVDRAASRPASRRIS